MPDPFKGFLTLSQVARVLGVSKARVHQLSREGVIPFVETPLGRLYRDQVIRKLAQKGWPGRNPNRARGGRARWGIEEPATA